MMKKILVYCLLASLMIIPAAESQVKIFYYTPPAGVPKNVVIIMASGMGVSQLTAAMIENGGTLNIEKFPYTGLIKPWANGNVVPDAASNATAIATGRKVNNGRMGIDNAGKVIGNIFEYAKSKRMATGMVITGSVLNSTLVGFALHDTSGLQSDYPIGYLKSDIDLLIGGGSKFFDQRTDNRNVLQDFYNKGYEIEKKAKRVGKLKGEKALALVGEEDIYRARARKDYLEDATLGAMNFLSRNGFGYVLLVDASKIAEAAAINDSKYMTEEILDLDNTIGKIYDIYSRDPQTLVIVMANHETGGLAITGGDPATKKTPKVDWSTRGATGSLVPVFAMGPGAEKFMGVYDNTEIYTHIMNLLAGRNYK